MTQLILPLDQGFFFRLNGKLVSVSINEDHQIEIDFNARYITAEKNKGHVIYTYTLREKEKKS